MTTPAIQVRGLGKLFRIGARQDSHKRLTEVVTDLALAPLRRLQRIGKPVPPGEEIWALRDVSFDVMPGEVVGVIGRNGAGKSTLLKILSRITEPTTGEVILRGRVGSLLEVGTGFHPELTGRENIYLNGAILGMKREEIRRKFDEIVAFAEIDKFLDTPVKRYSSGMYVRLAFAVAAHLEPEILLVDEVLAVGDAQFQKKCLGKMGDVAKGGRTVLFVSHNMGMIAALCEHGVLLENGRVAAVEPIRGVLERYFRDEREASGEVRYDGDATLPGDDFAQLLSARTVGASGRPTTELRVDEELAIEMEYRVLRTSPTITPNFHLYDAQGSCLLVASDAAPSPHSEEIWAPGRYLARCRIPANFLNDGIIYIGVALTTMRTVTVHFFEPDLLRVRVMDPVDGIITRGEYRGPIPGAVRPAFSWTRERLP